MAAIRREKTGAAAPTTAAAPGDQRFDYVDLFGRTVGGSAGRPGCDGGDGSSSDGLQEGPGPQQGQQGHGQQGGLQGQDGRGNNAASVRQSPFFKVTGHTASGASRFPVVSVKGAFSRGAAATDAIMILRMLANHYMKNPVGDSVLNFLENIWREIAMKSGALGADLAARDALVHRFLV